MAWGWGWSRFDGASCVRRCVGVTLVAVAVALIATIAATGAQAAEGSAAVAWGENYHGQLGQIYKDTREEFPVGVEAGQEIASVKMAEGMGLALLNSGELKSWGGNNYGQLGDDTFEA